MTTPVKTEPVLVVLTVYKKRVRARLALLLALGAACAADAPLVAVRAQVAPAPLAPKEVGIIEGRIFNEASGSYINNARISLKGSGREVFSNAIGEYRLANVEPGKAELVVSVGGLETKSVAVVVEPGLSTRLDVSLGFGRSAGDDGSSVVALSEFAVLERVMSGQAMAMQEQRTAVNIKNVMTLDEIGELGEGNAGEYLKFVPGFSAVYGPNGVNTVTLRGMPAYGTQVMIDGVPASSPGTSRSFDFNVAVTANVDRMEVVKSPTPDMPANSVGGSVNIVTKEPFGRKEPVFTYNTFLTYSGYDGFDGFKPKFKKRPGPDASGGRMFNGSTNYDVQPSFDLSYTHPVNESLAVSVMANRTIRTMDWVYLTPTWNQTTGVQTANQFNNVITGAANAMVSGKVDWRIGRHDTLKFSVIHSLRETFTRQNIINSNPGAGATGGEDFTQGASTGVGSITQSAVPFTLYRSLNHVVLSHRHDGEVWKLGGEVSFSGGGYDIRDMKDGVFGRVNATLTGLVLRHEGLSGIYDRRVPTITATRGGAPVNHVNGNDFGITTVLSSPREIKNDASRAAIDVMRKNPFDLPLDVKVGAVVDQAKVENRAAPKTWNFTPPGGAAGRTASNFNVIAQEYSDAFSFTAANGAQVKPTWLSAEKMYDLYRQHPEWFVLDESAAHISEVNGAYNIKETITAGYVRLDSKLLDNRLWLIGGVRYELTEVGGRGPKNDISATYAKNPDGTIARDSNGRPMPITTNALERTRLQYQRLAASTERDHDGFFPSMNVSYHFSERFVVRGAYARTIGRPDYANLFPTATATDPGSETVDKVITVSNPGLKPWTSNSYDVTFEAYDVKQATFAASLFQKDIEGFFSSRRSPATRDILTDYGFTDDFLDYDIQTTVNGGSATIKGLELSYRQSFGFLPRWGRGLQVFANLTKLRLSGPNADDFTNFTPTEFNWGVGYGMGKFYVRANTVTTDPNRVQLASAATSSRAAVYDYRGALTRTDISVGYQLSKRFVVYAVVRNLQSAEIALQRYDPSTPQYLRPRNYQFSTTDFTLGVRGEF